MGLLGHSFLYGVNRATASHMYLLPVLGATLAVFLFGGGVAHAQTSQALVSNLGQTFQTVGAVLPDGTAQGFRTGPTGTGYTLTSIDLELQFVPAATQFPTITLHSGSAAGSKVADFTAPSTPGSLDVYTFTPTTTVTLAPNTDYWVVATSGVVGIDWGVVYADEDATPAPGWSIHDRGQYNDGTGFEDYLADLATQIRVNGAINDAPTLTLADERASEGVREMEFEVGLSGASSEAVTVSYATTAGTATAGQDYESQSGTLTFLANSTTPQTITVPLINDAIDEAEAETFTVRLHNAMPSPRRPSQERYWTT